jgi:hypothetical protein
MYLLTWIFNVATNLKTAVESLLLSLSTRSNLGLLLDTINPTSTSSVYRRLYLTTTSAILERQTVSRPSQMISTGIGNKDHVSDTSASISRYTNHSSPDISYLLEPITEPLTIEIWLHVSLATMLPFCRELGMVVSYGRLGNYRPVSMHFYLILFWKGMDVYAQS